MWSDLKGEYQRGTNLSVHLIRFVAKLYISLILEMTWHFVIFVLKSQCPSFIQMKESVTYLLADTTQLGQPQLDILSIAIIGMSLFMNVKVSGSALRIKPNACDIAPIPVIGRGIVVHEPRLEPFCTGSPVQTHVLNQKGSHILPQPVTHCA